VRWLVTGSGGYIGAHLLQILRHQNIEFLPLVGNSSDSVNRIKFLGVQGVQADMLSARSLLDCVVNYSPDVVVHLASMKSPNESRKNPDYFLKKNQISLQNIFRASEKSGSKIFINASSSAIYGNLDGKSISESTPGSPISTYGLSKFMAEKYLDSIKNSNMKVCSLRFFNIIGSTHFSLQDKSTFHLVPATISRIKSNQPPIVLGRNLPTIDGTPIRDYLHVMDAVGALVRIVHLLFSNNFMTGSTSHFKINVGSGKGSSVLEIITLIQQLMGTDLIPEVQDAREGDPVSSIADISLLKRTIGFKSSFTIKQILESCI